MRGESKGGNFSPPFKREVGRDFKKFISNG
jgi:hypothetical protein